MHVSSDPAHAGRAPPPTGHAASFAFCIEASTPHATGHCSPRWLFSSSSSESQGPSLLLAAYPAARQLLKVVSAKWRMRKEDGQGPAVPCHHRRPLLQVRGSSSGLQGRLLPFSPPGPCGMSSCNVQFFRKMPLLQAHGRAPRHVLG